MVEITGCGRTVAADLVAFSMEWAGELPPGPLVWALRVTSPDGREGVELACERTPAGIHQYVADRTSGRREDVPQDVDVEAEQLTARFPAAAVGVAVEWPTWQAVLLADGTEVAARALPAS